MILIRYIIFAVFSTLVNITSQILSLHLYSASFSLYIAMFVGTLSGLILKYILDKKYIFYHTPKNKKDDGKKFLLYTFMGGITTIIFWGFELGFDMMFHSEQAKYIGAVIGLSIGYYIKYHLDKKFVFKGVSC